MTAIEQNKENFFINKKAIGSFSCGEVFLIENEWRVIFSCSYCNKASENISYFLKHTLEHLPVPKEKIDSIIETTIRERVCIKHLAELRSPGYVQDNKKSSNNVVNTQKREGIGNRTMKTNLMVTRDGSSNFDLSERMNEIKNAIKREEAAKLEEANGSNKVSSVSSANAEVDLVSIEGEQEQIISSGETSSAPLQTKEIKVTRFKSFKKVVAKNGNKTVEFKGKGPYTCSKCGKKINNRYYFKTHLLIHESIKPFHCDICDVSFAERAVLTVHRKRHLGIKRYCCEVCEKKFVSSTEVKIHKRTHTEERPYKFEICCVAYTTSSQLCLHRRTTHTKERPHKCAACNKSFFQRIDLQRHSLQHSGERPYICTVCNKEFATLKFLR